MDFRFRANDNKSPATAASSSIRSSDQPLQDDSLNAELLKQRIKEEIMIRDIANRRILEAEIRRELILEQELAMRRAECRTEGLSLDDQFSVRFLDQIGMNHIVNPSRGLQAVPGSSSLLLPVRPVPDPQNEEPKPFDDQKNKLIVLPRTDAGKFERKRKAEGEAEASDTDQTIPTPWISSKKLAKEKFFCSICKVKATSEINFNAHLKGKKHMAKEGRRGLQTQEPSEEEDQKEKLDDPLKSTEQKAAIENKRAKFWCKICEIGTHCMANMVTHNNGKKHKARLLKLSNDCKLEDHKEKPL